MSKLFRNISVIFHYLTFAFDMWEERVMTSQLDISFFREGSISTELLLSFGSKAVVPCNA